MLDEGAGDEGDLVVFGGRVEGFVENTKFSLGLADWFPLVLPFIEATWAIVLTGEGDFTDGGDGLAWNEGGKVTVLKTATKSSQIKISLGLMLYSFPNSQIG